MLEKYTIKLILAISKKKIFYKKKKWFVDINKTYIHIFYSFQIHTTFEVVAL